jgi:hypothetical protein
MRATCGKILASAMLLATTVAYPQQPPQTYVIQASADDELFIINGQRFKAKLHCLGMRVGDRVRFLEGSPNGLCTTALLLNLRSGNECSVWCD